jgi:hypothetical protein
MFIYPIYNHNWRNIYIYIYIYITRLASNEIFSPSNKIYWEVGRAKDLSAPRYVIFCARKVTPYQAAMASTYRGTGFERNELSEIIALGKW